MNRVFLTKLHLIAAAIMFPAILMFLVTGALYTWGNTGEWREETVLVPLEQPLSEDEAQLKQVALAGLAQQGLSAPSGKTKVSNEDGEISLSWSGARSEAKVVATDDPLVAEVEVKEASFHRWLVQLHKAKGSTAFKLYATVLAIVLFLLVLSGVIMGLQVKALRKLTITWSIVGGAAFAGFVLLG